MTLPTIPCCLLLPWGRAGGLSWRTGACDQCMKGPPYTSSASPFILRSMDAPDSSSPAASLCGSLGLLGL